MSNEICNASCRASDLGVGLYPGASGDSRGPRLTLTWRPLMKHEGGEQLLVHTINRKFKKMNLKQPKSVCCWSPLPRLPGEYTYLIWGGCRGVCGVRLLGSSTPASGARPTHVAKHKPRVFRTPTGILTSHGGAPIQRNPILRKG